jgi:hypothetical protein
MCRVSLHLFTSSVNLFFECVTSKTKQYHKKEKINMKCQS